MTAARAHSAAVDHSSLALVRGNGCNAVHGAIEVNNSDGFINFGGYCLKNRVAFFSVLHHEAVAAFFRERLPRKLNRRRFGRFQANCGGASITGYVEVSGNRSLADHAATPSFTAPHEAQPVLSVVGSGFAHFVISLPVSFQEHFSAAGLTGVDASTGGGVFVSATVPPCATLFSI